MDWFISSAMAQAEGSPPSLLGSMLPLIIIFVLFWFMLIRPQMKRAKEHREMVSRLERGDEVLTNGGLLGKIEEVSDGFVTLEIATNVKVKLQRQAVTAVLPKGTLKAAG